MRLCGLCEILKNQNKKLDSVISESSARANNMEKEKLLIVEDDTELSTQMKWGLSKEYRIFQAEDRSGALEIFQKERPAVVTLDLGLPPQPDGVEEGFRTLEDILNHDPFTKVIVITGRHEKEHALAAIGNGAYDFLAKPVQLKELQVILGRAFHVARLEREHRELQKQVHGDIFEKMLGTSPEMHKVFEMIRKVATTDAPVLILGESGTGKELAARAVHSRSARRDGPFVAIDCGAIPETLLESELFGHEKGAFTGAHIQRQDRIEAAQKGTLFLDEIGELSPYLQAKLLRFLQETANRAGRGQRRHPCGRTGSGRNEHGYRPGTQRRAFPGRFVLPARGRARLHAPLRRIGTMTFC